MAQKGYIITYAAAKSLGPEMSIFGGNICMDYVLKCCAHGLDSIAFEAGS